MLVEMAIVLPLLTIYPIRKQQLTPHSMQNPPKGELATLQFTKTMVTSFGIIKMTMISSGRFLLGIPMGSNYINKKC